MDAVGLARILRLDPLAPADVLLERHDIEMVRIDTAAITAQMINR